MLEEFHSPQLPQAPPTHIQTTTLYNEDQPEPLLSLVTSQYPLAGAVIHGSLSAYKTTQSYIPGAEWTERHVGLPIAGTVARISGVEGGLRWALQPKRDTRSRGTTTPRTPDVEKGSLELNNTMLARRESDMSFAETLPAYNATDRSPPYEQQATLTRDRHPPPGWRQQLVISTSGLGIAMSEESLRSLRFCLGWLKWANDRLGGAIQNLKDLLEHWSEDPASQNHILQTNGSGMSQDEAEGRQAVLSARISALKAEVLQTLKQVVGVVSTYAGGALPDNARNLVHRHLTSLPQRFSIATAQSSSSNAQTDSANDATNSANRVMVLAQEGLDMMTQVSRVVNDTLVSAEGWCEKLGRSTGRDSSLPQHQQRGALLPEKSDDQKRNATTHGECEKEDVQMEM